MKGKLTFPRGALCAVLIASLLLPALAFAQAKQDPAEAFKQRRLQLIKDLKLPPEKEKSLLAVEEKYAQDRKGIIDSTRKANADLQEVLKAATPDEAKIKGLVATVTAGQDKLFASFQSQRNEELALMTPVEQAKYLVALGKWREEMMAKQKKGQEPKK